MATFLSPSIQVNRIRKGPVTLQGSNSVSVGGFIGIAERGVPGTPQKLTSFSDFLQIYGGYLTTSYLAETVDLFFKNGGQFCYVSRAAHYSTISNPASYDMVAATLNLSNSTPTAVLTVNASSPGAWGNNYKITTTRQSTLLTTLGTALTAGAKTSAILTSVSRINLGDLLTIADGTNSITVTVTSINTATNQIGFASTTVAVGGIGTSGSSVNLLTFTLQAINASGTVEVDESNLRMSSLSSRYVVTVINSLYRTPILVVDLAVAEADTRPAAITGTPLASGSDGTTPVAADYAGNSAGTGVYAFNQVSDFGMLSIPGITDATTVGALIDYAELRKIFIAIPDIPQGSAPSAAITFAGTTVNKYSAYAAYLYPWVKILDPVTNTKVSTPPSGIWQGIIARTDQTRGPWKAPAGIVDGLIAGIVGVDYSVQQPDYDLLYPAKINAIQSFSGEGTAVMGNTTLDITGEFIELSVCRLFLYIEKSVKESIRWVNFEPNNTSTRARVTRNVRAFLKDLWQKEALVGSKPDDAFFVICDETNNPVTIQAQRKLICRIGIAPVHASEFVEFTVEQDTRAIDAAAASSV